ncbi:hypothetical protein [Tritonibacter mobilis]|uniref:Uncharacterized protein n=1 Tax=Tritonibacter mobilis F1926 TaxID=1265309 RepID=A0A1B1A314_9RHOB|nr:hypothetical protein [Tritonibacter mobilis]ANP40888.1 hypothetical protein K529_008945 [Tritonibacter mobilis F1926]KJZ24212.1 hypothetical protein TW79_10245 [Tritonibacter mobilis]
MNVFLLSAAALAAVWTLVHGIVGGRQSARPLAADQQLIPVVRETVLLCWHLVTAGIGIAVPPLRGVSYRVLPQGWLFVPVVLLAAWGLWG